VTVVVDVTAMQKASPAAAPNDTDVTNERKSDLGTAAIATESQAAHQQSKKNPRQKRSRFIPVAKKVKSRRIEEKFCPTRFRSVNFDQHLENFGFAG
jgi:hypothetical protein